MPPQTLEGSGVYRGVRGKYPDEAVSIAEKAVVPKHKLRKVEAAIEC